MSEDNKEWMQKNFPDLIFSYSDKLDLWILCVDHFGTMWKGVSTTTNCENAARRVDLIKWTHDNTFSIAEVNKDTGKLEVADVPETDELEAYKHFYRKCGDIAIIS